MKKHIISLVSILILSISLFSGCGKKVASLQSVINSEEPLYETFQGMERKSLLRSWGEPIITNKYSDLWKSDGKYVEAYYEDDKVTSLNHSSTMRVKVIQNWGESALVEPEEGQWERNSADRIIIPLDAMDSEVPSTVTWGDILEIEYNGMLMETYPAQIATPYSIKLVHDEEDIKDVIFWNNFYTDPRPDSHYPESLGAIFYTETDDPDQLYAFAADLYVSDSNLSEADYEAMNSKDSKDMAWYWIWLRQGFIPYDGYPVEDLLGEYHFFATLDQVEAIMGQTLDGYSLYINSLQNPLAIEKLAKKGIDYKTEDPRNILLDLEDVFEGPKQIAVEVDFAAIN